MMEELTMKKLFVLFSAAFLAFAACQDEIAPVVDNSGDDVMVKDYPVEMTFTATSELGTKTTLNGTSVTWNSGDKIKVLWAEGSNAAETAEGGQRLRSLPVLMKESQSSGRHILMQNLQH